MHQVTSMQELKDPGFRVYHQTDVLPAQYTQHVPQCFKKWRSKTLFRQLSKTSWSSPSSMSSRATSIRLLLFYVLALREMNGMCIGFSVFCTHIVIIHFLHSYFSVSVWKMRTLVFSLQLMMSSTRIPIKWKHQSPVHQRAPFTDACPKVWSPHRMLNSTLV